ncbi:hypothetical protein [Pseudarthrobacter sp. AB1]|uniref:hypothetical protein n=1 Tax=Pseudarthrobacter sp. AB1 TaxID=2138309 RepID=UPI00186BA4AD|nr:hypothetical protein [Pseudarthrobacter sp. AB1]MBE4720512.1 hypothetical protein [Pseudarthrobacter sp. AB1]
MGQEQVDIRFRAAWDVFAQTCGHFWAPEPSYQAWFAHYLISQFGIDRVAREPLIHIKNFTESPLKSKVGGGEVRPDVVVTREPGIMMPHYANQLGKASDRSGLGLLKTLTVVSEFKIGASAQKGLKMSELIRDTDKLQLLLNEFEVQHPGVEPPRAYACVLDNHGRQKFDPNVLREYCGNETPGVVPLIVSTEARPLISADRLITR